MHWNVAPDALPVSATIGPLAERLIWTLNSTHISEAQDTFNLMLIIIIVKWRHGYGVLHTRV